MPGEACKSVAMWVRGEPRLSKILRAGNARAAGACLPRHDLAALFVDRAAFHHELDVLERGDVGQRVAVDGHDVGEAAGAHTANVLFVADEIGWRPSASSRRRPSAQIRA